MVAIPSDIKALASAAVPDKLKVANSTHLAERQVPAYDKSIVASFVAQHNSEFQQAALTLGAKPMLTGDVAQFTGSPDSDITIQHASGAMANALRAITGLDVKSLASLSRTNSGKSKSGGIGG